MIRLSKLFTENTSGTNSSASTEILSVSNVVGFFSVTPTTFKQRKSLINASKNERSVMEDNLTKVAEESARGGFFLASGSFTASAIMAITSIIVARFLGAEFYGQYILALVVPQLLFLFADFGISQGMSKFAASLRTQGKTSQAARIIKSGILFRAIVGLMVFLINFALADLFASVLLRRPELGFYVRIASLSILFQVISATAAAAYVAIDKTEYNAVSTNIQAIVKAIVSIGLVAAGFGIVGAVLGFVAGFIVGGMIGLGFLLIMLREKSSNKNGDPLSFNQGVMTLVRYGMPLYISALLVGFLSPYQNLILSIFTKDIDVGNFQVAVNLMTFITVVSIPITTALLPAFSKLDSTTNGKTKSFFIFANKYTTLLIVPIATALMILANEVVHTIYGSGYQTAGLFLAIYCSIYFLAGIGNLTLTSLFNGLGKTRIAFKISLISFIIVIPLTPFLTSLFGVPGLIISFVVASAVSTCYGMYVARRNFGITFGRNSLLKIYAVAAISSIPTLLFLRMLHLSSLLSLVSGGILYFAMYLTLTPLAGIVNRSELQTISRVTQKIRPLGPIVNPLLRYQQKILSRLK